MNVLKPLAIATVGIAISIGGTSAAFAKGHDQGVADGSRGGAKGLAPGALRGGLVADLVAARRNLDEDFVYGRDVVKVEAADGGRGITPVVGKGKNSRMK